MTQLEDGYLIILPRDEAKTFFGQRDDESRLLFLNELLSGDETNKVSCEGRWQELHDILSEANIEESALGQCLLGGRPLHRGDDHHVCMVRPDIVRIVAAQISSFTESDFSATTWNLAQAVSDLYRQAAELAGAVVFVAKI